jgi:ubiquinone/menaquinone biosynthesis C-methylase UbiE
VGHKFEVQNIERLLTEDRLGEISPGDLLRGSGLGEGMVFADIGCGPGFFTFPAASIVGTSGKVYAVDLQEEMLEELRKRGVPPNVFPLKSGENSTPLLDGSVDFTLLAYVLHEASDRQTFLMEVRRIAKEGGTVLVVDWEKKEEDKGPPVEDRVSMEQALELLTGAGFRIMESGSISPSHWKVLAERGRQNEHRAQG